MERLNVQAAVRAYLAEKIPNAETRVTIPSPRPERLVVVRRVDGAMQDQLLDFAKVEALIYAPTESEAYKLAQEVSGAMLALSFADGYAKVRESYFYTDYDEDAKNPRWYAQYELTTYQPKE